MSAGPDIGWNFMDDLLSDIWYGLPCIYAFVQLAYYPALNNPHSKSANTPPAGFNNAILLDCS